MGDSSNSHCFAHPLGLQRPLAYQRSTEFFSLSPVWRMCVFSWMGRICYTISWWNLYNFGWVSTLLLYFWDTTILRLVALRKEIFVKDRLGPKPQNDESHYINSFLYTQKVLYLNCLFFWGVEIASSSLTRTLPFSFPTFSTGSCPSSLAALTTSSTLTTPSRVRFV